MKFWIISEVFYPDEVSTAFVMTRIAEKLADGNDVNVICSSGMYDSKNLKATYEIDKNIKIFRVKIPLINKNSFILRIFRIFLLSIKMGYLIITKIKSSDKVILVTNPPLLLVIVSLIKRIKGFRYCVIVHDIFPENMHAAGMINSNSIFYKILMRLFNWAYNKTEQLIVVGEDMKEIVSRKLKGKIENIEVIQNWAEVDSIHPKSNFDKDNYYNTNLDSKIVIQFAGNIGRVQGLDNFFKILVEVKSERFCFIIIGDGALKEQLLSLKTRYNLHNILFYPSKPRNQQNDFLNACDIGLVTLSSGMFGLGVPSKVYNLLAAGKPILYIGDDNSEISQYVQNFDIGWHFNWNDKEGIKYFLENLSIENISKIRVKGIAARKLVENKFTQYQILKKYNTILNNF